MKKSPSRVIKPIETKNLYSTLESEESPTENGNTRINSPNVKVTARQNAVNTATQNMPNSNDKTENETMDKRNLQVTVILGNSMVKDIKDWKCQVVLAKLR